MKYFTYDELCATSRPIPNNPTSDIKLALLQLVRNVLDPAREAYGKPIKVNSGFRCERLNRAVGGVSNSQHIKGEAADITGGSPEENRKLFKLIKKRGKFDQLISENDYQWIHVSWKAYGVNRKQIIYQ